MTNSRARRASSWVGEPGELMGEMVLDFGGGMHVVFISGLLRLRLMTFGFWKDMEDFDLSISRGDSRIATVGCWASPLRSWSICSSAERRVGSIGRGKVWLRGRLVLLLGRRDWLVGVNGLSETRVEVGLIIPAEEVVSSDVILLEYPRW